MSISKSSDAARGNDGVRWVQVESKGVQKIDDDEAFFAIGKRSIHAFFSGGVINIRGRLSICLSPTT